jgi:hypothetical protein
VAQLAAGHSVLLEDLRERYGSGIPGGGIAPLFGRADLMRLADAQQSLKVKQTKAVRESERIATNKAQSLAGRLADLKRTEEPSGDSRSGAAESQECGRQLGRSFGLSAATSASS